jgi:hypothetical protein
VAAESGFKRGGVELRGMGRGWGDVLRHSVQNIFEDAGVGRKGRKKSAHEGCVALQIKIISHWRRKAGSVYNFYAFEVEKQIDASGLLRKFNGEVFLRPET